MRNLIILFFTSLSTFCFSQSDDLPHLLNYFCVSTNWPDTITVHQKLYWPNGKIKVEYAHLRDSIKVRKEYFESGNLKLTAEIFQSFSRDTSYTEDANNPGTFIVEATSGFIDILHGKYVEYIDVSYVNVKTTGSFKSGLQFGEWTKRQADASFIVANFNSNGYLDGAYFEYYYNGKNERADIKWKGQFAVVSYSYTQEQERTFKPDPRGETKVTKSVKTGKWEHYDRVGGLLETITYQWEKK